MKNWFRGTKITVCILVLLGFAVVLKKSYTYLFAMRSCVITLDPLFSDVMQHDIADFLEEHPELHNTSFKQLVCALQQQFPCIQSVSAQRCASGALELDVAAVVPLFNINNDKILAHNGQLYTRDIFSQVYSKNLDAITVVLEDTDPSVVFKHCVQQLLPTVCAQYDVAWMNEREVRLQDKKNKKFSCICDATTLPDEQMLALLDQVKIDVCNNHARARAKGWVADMRFSKQIIVRSEQRGQHG